MESRKLKKQTLKTRHYKILQIAASKQKEHLDFVLDKEAQDKYKSFGDFHVTLKISWNTKYNTLPRQNCKNTRRYQTLVLTA